jgi:hypothetical protein
MFFIVILIYMSTPNYKKRGYQPTVSPDPNNKRAKSEPQSVPEDQPVHVNLINAFNSAANAPNQNGGKRTRRRKNGNKKRKTLKKRRKTLKKRRKTRRRKGVCKLHGGKTCGCKLF